VNVLAGCPFERGAAPTWCERGRLYLCAIVGLREHGGTAEQGSSRHGRRRLPFTRLLAPFRAGPLLFFAFLLFCGVLPSRCWRPRALMTNLRLTSPNVH
jgi:hypothetical protein